MTGSQHGKIHVGHVKSEMPMRTVHTVPQEAFTNPLVDDQVFGYELPKEVLQGYFSQRYLAITQSIFETSVLSAAHTLRVD